MATTANRTGEALERRTARREDEPSSELPQRRKSRPIIFFAIAGAIAVALQAYAFTRWILSGPARTPNGPTPVPHWMTIYTLSLQLLGVAIVLAIGYFCVVRPLRRDRCLHWDGYLYIALISIAWQDPYSNLWRPYFVYSTAFIQFGSWFDFMPFVHLPNAATFPEPFIATIPAYVWYNFPLVMVACALMRVSKTRWPKLGLTGQLTIGWTWLVCADLIVEALFVRSGYWAYVGPGPSWFTLEFGEAYQLPLMEPVLWGTVMSAIAALRFHRDDKGRSFVERGVDELHITRRAKGWIRALALIGACNLFFLAYNLSAASLSMAGAESSWPKDIINRSYMNDGICGVGTDRHCPGGDVPLQLEDKSIYIDRDGIPVYPEGNPYAETGPARR